MIENGQMKQNHESNMINMNSIKNVILNLENTLIQIKGNGIMTEYALEDMNHNIKLLKLWAGMIDPKNDLKSELFREETFRRWSEAGLLNDINNINNK